MMKKLISCLMAGVLAVTMLLGVSVTAAAEDFAQPVVEIIEEEDAAVLKVTAPMTELLNFFSKRSKFQNMEFYFNIEAGGYEFILRFYNSDLAYEYDIRAPKIGSKSALLQACSFKLSTDNFAFTVKNTHSCAKALKKAEEVTYTYYMVDELGRLFYGSDEAVTKPLGDEVKDISELEFGEIKSYTCTGKARKPAVTIMDGDYKLKKGTDYSVSYKNNKEIGTATVTVKGKGEYGGKKTLTFKINPKKPTLKAVKKSDKKIKLTWEAIEGADNYQIYYSENGGDYEKLITVSGKATSSTISTLDLKNNSYKFKIRAYSEVDGKKYYSSFSKIVKYN